MQAIVSPERALMPPSAPGRHRWPACRAASAMAAGPLGGREDL